MKEQIKNFLLQKNFHFLPNNFEIKLIGNGAYNTNFLIEGEKKFVFRVNTHIDKVSGNGLDNEHAILTNIPPGIAPKSYYVDVSRVEFPFPFRIEEFKEGSHPTEFSEDLIVILAKNLALLHKKKFSLCGAFPGKETTFSLQKFIQPFIDAVKGKDPKVDAIIEKASKYMKFHDQHNPLTVFSLIHFDIHVENMLYNQEDLTLVDWEYAQIGDPAIDIATLFWYSYMFNYTTVFSKKQRKSFLDKYIEASNDVEIVSRLKIVEPLVVLIETMWIKAQLDNINQIPLHIRTEDRIDMYKKGFEICLNFLKDYDFSV